MADTSLAYYSQFLNSFAGSRRLFPFSFEKTTRCMASAVRVRCCWPVFSGHAIGKGSPAFRVSQEIQRPGSVVGTNPVHALAPHWVGIPFPGARWRFGHFFKQHF